MKLLLVSIILGLASFGSLSIKSGKKTRKRDLAIACVAFVILMLFVATTLRLFLNAGISAAAGMQGYFSANAILSGIEFIFALVMISWATTRLEDILQGNKKESKEDLDEGREDYVPVSVDLSAPMFWAVAILASNNPRSQFFAAVVGWVAVVVLTSIASNCDKLPLVSKIKALFRNRPQLFEIFSIFAVVAVALAIIAEVAWFWLSGLLII